MIDAKILWQNAIVVGTWEVRMRIKMVDSKFPVCYNKKSVQIARKLFCDIPVQQTFSQHISSILTCAFHQLWTTEKLVRMSNRSHSLPVAYYPSSSQVADWCSSLTVLSLSSDVKKELISLHKTSPITELGGVTCHMGSHSVTCHPKQVNASTLTPASKLVLDLPTRRDGRLSWPRLSGLAPAGSRTHELSITSQTP